MHKLSLVLLTDHVCYMYQMLTNVICSENCLSQTLLVTALLFGMDIYLDNID